MSAPAPGRKPIGEILIDQGSLEPEKLNQALQLQTTDKRLIGQILISRGYVKRHHLDIALAKQKHTKR